MVFETWGLQIEVGAAFRVCHLQTSTIPPFPCASASHERQVSRILVISYHSFSISPGQIHSNFSCKFIVNDNSSSRDIQVVEKVKMTYTDYSKDFQLSSLTALCPLYGRYWDKVNILAPILNEYGWIRFRVLVQIKWLLKLSQIHEILEVPSFSEDAQTFLQKLFGEFSMMTL